MEQLRFVSTFPSSWLPQPHLQSGIISLGGADLALSMAVGRQTAKLTNHKLALEMPNMNEWGSADDAEDGPSFPFLTNADGKAKNAVE